MKERKKEKKQTRPCEKANCSVLTFSPKRIIIPMGKFSRLNCDIYMPTLPSRSFVSTTSRISDSTSYFPSMFNESSVFLRRNITLKNIPRSPFFCYVSCHLIKANTCKTVVRIMNMILLPPS